jgi:hypothetical protein
LRGLQRPKVTINMITNQVFQEIWHLFLHFLPIDNPIRTFSLVKTLQLQASALSAIQKINKDKKSIIYS